MLERDPYYLSLHRAEGESRGTVLLLHGGGWHGDLGPAADELMSATIEVLLDWGYDVANIGYRSGAAGLADARAATEEMRARLGPEEPLCLYGTSAGAQLALVVAAERAGAVDCVVDLLGPPNLEDFGSRELSSEGERQARAAFGEGEVAAVSPLNVASRVPAPVLIGAATCDAYIEPADQRELAGRLPDADLVAIERGDDVDLEHCVVDDASFDRFLERTREFLGAVAPAPEAADPAPADGDGSSFPLGLVVGGAAAAAGAALLVRALRR